MILGSGACFLVLESREHASARGVEALAVLSGVVSDRMRREPGASRRRCAAKPIRSGRSPTS